MSDDVSTTSRALAQRLDRAIAAAFEQRAEINRLHQEWLEALAREPGALAAALSQDAAALRPGARMVAQCGPFERTFILPATVTHAGHSGGQG